MKKLILSAMVVSGLAACSSTAYKYEGIYDDWKNEMVQINNAHGEALVILKGFEQKIHHHQAKISEFARFLIAAQQQAKSLSAQGKAEELAALEQEVIVNSLINAEKHQHFNLFLQNLASLKSGLENQLVVISESSESMPVFNSYQEAVAYWVVEMDSINSGQEQALAIIADIRQHIENHENHISEFGYHITQDKLKADKVKSQDKALKTLEQRIEQNYLSNMEKHQKFALFLGYLQQVKGQFEGK